MMPITAISPTQLIPQLPVVQDESPKNLIINQTNNAFVSGNVGSIFMANEIDLGNVPDNTNITINQTNNVFMMAAAGAYEKTAQMSDMFAAWLKELLAGLVTDQSSPANVDMSV